MSDLRRRQTAAQIGALVLANGMIFHEVLAAGNPKVKSLRTLLKEEDFWTRLSEHWQYIQKEIDYVPIFRVAEQVIDHLPNTRETQTSLRILADEVLKIVQERAALRHDLMGRIYHTLLLEAKYLGTYYTSVSAATLLLKLALEFSRWQIDWSNLVELRKFKVADLACGTGTLLMATQQAITDNYVRSKIANGETVSVADSRDLHRAFMEDILNGYDVLASAVHLTASTLAILAPEIGFEKMNLWKLPLGGNDKTQVHLGSIDYATADRLHVQFDLMRDVTAAAGTTGQGNVESSAPLPEEKLDLCVMNPPFTRSVGGNLLFGSLPAKERKIMQAKLADLLKRAPNGERLLANSTAGLGAVFVAVADRHVKENGRMALVLPQALASGVAWQPTRELFAKRYVVETVVVSHDPLRWNFSDSTSLSEMLIVARKRVVNEDVSKAKTTFVNLWRNSSSVLSSLATAKVILDAGPAEIEGGHGVSAVTTNRETTAEMVSVPWMKICEGQWHPCNFAQTELVRTAHYLREGQLYIAPQGIVAEVPLTHLGSLGELGPDRRDVYDGFELTSSRTSYPAFWGHDAETVVTMQAKPNQYLNPLNKARRTRKLRDVGLLWPRAGSVMLTERMRLNTQRLTAVRLPKDCLSNTWWPFHFHDANGIFEKALVLWSNSTLGLMILLSHRVPTEGAWVQFKKPIYETMPVLDLWRLDEKQLTKLAATYDEVAEEALLSLPEMEHDPMRAKIDECISSVLGLPPLDRIRAALGREPVIALRRL